jgi:UDP-N-acetylmuramyl pentapeptide phosphotransferase/UDP-N-acetylglucosamine-1-phosphate transferase
MTGSPWMPLMAFALTLVALLFLLGRGWAGHLAIDTPNLRSLHASPTPRIGGVIMVPVALASSIPFSQGPGLLLVLAAALCAISFFDDRWGLPIALRLVSHIAAAAMLCHSLLPSPVSWGFGLAVLVLVWAINLFNFMDGSDGLAGGMALAGFAVFGAALLDTMPELARLALCIAAAAAGFLVLNFSPARVFMGDAGSVPLGFLAGGVGLAGWLHGVWPAWFPLLVFSPFVVDASVTLMRRVVRGERFWHPHRDHYYQRLVRMGWSHRRVALAEYGMMAGCGLSALALLRGSPVIQAAGVAAWAVIYVGAMLVIDRSWASCDECRGDRA